MTDPGLAATKSVLRAGAMARRDAIGETERAVRSARIVARLGTVVAEARAACVALYLPIRSEVDLRPLLPTLRAGAASIALPALSGGGIVFRAWREGEILASSVWGIREPPDTAPGATPDLVLMPMAGFDRSGHRLGYGKGHYDRAIAALQNAGFAPRLVGVAFAVQEVAPIPVTPHDLVLDLVVTEDEVLRF